MAEEQRAGSALALGWPSQLWLLQAWMNPTRAGKRGGMEGPAPRRGPAAFLGFGSQRVLGSLSPQGLSGPVPVSLWSHLQQCCGHLPRTLVSHKRSREWRLCWTWVSMTNPMR